MTMQMLRRTIQITVLFLLIMTPLINFVRNQNPAEGRLHMEYLVDRAYLPDFILWQDVVLRMSMGCSYKLVEKAVLFRRQRRDL